jgi:hypothetical protein
VTPSASDPVWTTVPAEQDGLEGQAFAQVICTGRSRIAGADWTAPANNQLSLDLALFQGGWPSAVGTFYATNTSTQPSTFAAFVGCIEPPRLALRRPRAAATPSSSARRPSESVRVPV